jgi:hypothetical protein
VQVRVLEKGVWLAIRLRPAKVWAYWGLGLLCIALGVGSLLLLGRGVRLHCEPDPAAACRLERVVLVGRRQATFPVAALTGARVETATAGIAAWMNLVLETDRGDHVIALTAADAAEKERLAGQVRAFVADPRAAPLDLAEDTRLLGIPFGLFLAAAGVVIILAMERVTLFADRSAGVMLIKGRRLTGSTLVEFKLTEIEGISTPSWYVRGAEGFGVVLHLTDRREQPLTRTPLFTAESAHKVSETLARFLGTGLLVQRRRREVG